MASRNSATPCSDLGDVNMRRAAAAAAGILIGIVPWAVASSHTETSFVAVPAGEEATMAFQPTHGCGTSATVQVRVLAPVPDARPGEVEGWTASATPDGEGNTVIEWTGGLLPADQTGTFPVEFLVPDAVGALLAFPAIQRCENGEELAWIGTEPGDERPAPHVLVLPPGSAPAPTLDDVPLDAPGRDQLVALLQGGDDDNPNAAAPTTPAGSTATPTTEPPETTSAPTTAAPTTSPATAPTTAADTVPSSVATTSPPTAPADEDGGGSSAGWIAAIVAAVVVVLGGGAAIVARRRSSSTPG